MEPFEFHLFAPISVLLDAFLRFTYNRTATSFGGGGYLDIVLPDNKLASFIIKAKVESKVLSCGLNATLRRLP